MDFFRPSRFEFVPAGIEKLLISCFASGTGDGQSVRSTPSQTWNIIVKNPTEMHQETNFYSLLNTYKRCFE